jgi:porphobilinogen synthase
LIGDLALDPYTSHGHDGILNDNGYVENDSTVEILAKASILAASAGYDVLAPSDMMDGRVGIIRSHLEKNGFTETCIMSYAAKFCSSYYGPFRDAIGASSHKPIEKSGYQLSPNNFREAVRELELDFEEGADILMVKPAEPFLDVIHYARNHFPVPIAAYQVSGEYSRITAAGLNGWLDTERCAIESLTSIKRAGADMILTYFAEKVSAII